MQNGRLKGRPFCFCVCMSESKLSPSSPKNQTACSSVLHCLHIVSYYSLNEGLSRYEHGLLLGHSPCALSYRLFDCVVRIPLSALNSLQGVEFQPCRLFLCPKSCTKNAPTSFLRTSTGVFQIAHIPYILSHFLILPSIQYNYLHIQQL